MKTILLLVFALQLFVFAEGQAADDRPSVLGGPYIRSGCVGNDSIINELNKYKYIPPARIVLSYFQTTHAYDSLGRMSVQVVSSIDRLDITLYDYVLKKRRPIEREFQLIYGRSTWCLDDTEKNSITDLDGAVDESLRRLKTSKRK